MSGAHTARVYTVFLLCLTLVIGSCAFFSTAAIGEQSVELSPSYTFSFSSYDAVLSWSQELYANSLFYSGTTIQVINASLGAPSNTTQTFGLSVLNANMTLTSIAKDHIEFTLTKATVSGNASEFAMVIYYYETNETFPLEVRIGSGTIGESNYYTSNAEFDIASSPAVLLNETSQFIEIKTLKSVGVTVQIGSLASLTETTSSSTTASSQSSTASQSTTSEIQTQSSTTGTETQTQSSTGQILGATLITAAALALISTFIIRRQRRLRAESVKSSQ